MADQVDKNRLRPDELLAALRERVASLSGEDLSLMVLAASQSTGDLSCREALAEECSMTVEEVESWETRIFYDGEKYLGGEDYQPPEQDDLVTISLRIQRELKKPL